MTETEIMERARMYLSKLAMGVNPLTDGDIPDDSILNNERIIRCLAYSADILGQVIANGGVRRAPRPASVPKAKRAEFSLGEEARCALRPLEEEVSLAALVRHINESVDVSAMRRLPSAAFTGWLCEVGLLNPCPGPQGRALYRPSEAGETLGIRLGRRTGRTGEYTVVLYSPQAQELILDNLEGIMDAYRARRGKTEESV